MRLLKVKVGMLTAAGAAMVVLLSGGSALASPIHGHCRTTTGPEVVYGAVYGKAANAPKPVIPVRLKGVVNTYGLVFVYPGRFHVIPTKAGKLNVLDVGKPQVYQKENWKTCFATFTFRSAAQIVGGTGAFWRAHGPAAYQLVHGAFYPRSKKGVCWFRTWPFNKGAVLKFLLAARLTVKKKHWH
jgi:hypothetical protein